MARYPSSSSILAKDIRDFDTSGNSNNGMSARSTKRPHNSNTRNNNSEELNDQYSKKRHYEFMSDSWMKNGIYEHMLEFGQEQQRPKYNYSDSFAPHITHIVPGYSRWDPVHSSIFEIQFKLPFVMQGEYDYKDMSILSKQIISVDGLDGMQKTVGMYKLKYLGVDVGFFNPNIDDSSLDFTINFNLNFRNISDNYVYKIFKEWFSLLYTNATGVRAFKDFCCAESMTILQANRDGTIWRQVVLHNVFVTSIAGMNTLDYNNSDPVILNVGFHADYWDETIA